MGTQGQGNMDGKLKSSFKKETDAHMKSNENQASAQIPSNNYDHKKEASVMSNSEKDKTSKPTKRISSSNDKSEENKAQRKKASTETKTKGKNNLANESLAELKIDPIKHKEGTEDGNENIERKSSKKKTNGDEYQKSQKNNSKTPHVHPLDHENQNVDLRINESKIKGLKDSQENFANRNIALSSQGHKNNPSSS